MSVVAIFHPTGLVARELRERLCERPDLYGEVRLLSFLEEEVGTLVEVAGAATFVQRADRGQLEDIDLVFLCGSIAASRPLLGALPQSAITVVLSPDAELRDGRPVVVGVSRAAQAAPGAVFLSPHPAVTMLSHLLHPLMGFGVDQAVATVIQPASVYGKEALDEVLDQARNLLSFQALQPSAHFREQIAFNLLPVEEPTETLVDLLQKVLDEPVPATLQIVQGGVFHGYSASLFVRFASRPAPQELVLAIQGHPFLRLLQDGDGRGPIEAAACSEVLVAAPRPDGRIEGGYWLWSVMDNLTRGGALNALAIAEALIG